ncbi:MAG: divalent-cation tolerance protein CutA [Candidatus Levybacteria bacterium]|nr:divalent-cation tolerance protein CutA [Candidatus Levybacteria bacterium]
MILILVSFEQMEHAEKAANYLIDHKLAACVEIFPVTNFYVWDGEKQKNSEISGIIKTTSENYEKVKAALEEILPYDIPQIIKVDATANDSYEKWVKESVKS